MQRETSITENGTYPPDHHLALLGWAAGFAAALGDSQPGSIPARIIGMGKNIFLAHTGTERLAATLSGRLLQEKERTVPVVGDWVLLREQVITGVIRRKNLLSRKASGARGRKSQGGEDEQALAANLDTLIIVCGLDRDFNPRRIERYLALAYGCAIEPVVVLTKTDLVPNPDRFLLQVEDLACGVPVFGVSAGDEQSVLQLAHLVGPGKTVALIGSSGAGKSTLINRLAGRDIRQTADVGARVGKGRHTTTSRDLIILPGGGMVIDNPGIREIGLTGDGDGVAAAFPEIEAAAGGCRFRDCNHVREAGCAVLAGVAAGTIARERLDSFHKLAGELSYVRQRERKSAARVEKERWREVALKVKSMKKKRY